MIEFKSFIDFPRGTMYEILKDAYSLDSRNKEIWDYNRKNLMIFSIIILK